MHLLDATKVDMMFLCLPLESPALFLTSERLFSLSKAYIATQYKEKRHSTWTVDIV